MNSLTISKAGALADLVLPTENFKALEGLWGPQKVLLGNPHASVGKILQFSVSLIPMEKNKGPAAEEMGL
jgi:hypothetical protein